MKEYHSIKQKEILTVVAFLNELKEKFPMLKYKDINLYELAKSLKVDVKDIKCMIAFEDYINTNRSFVTVLEVEEIKIKRKDNRWKFKIISTQKKETEYMEHDYIFE